MEIANPKSKFGHSEDLPNRIKSQRIKITIWKSRSQNTSPKYKFQVRLPNIKQDYLPTKIISPFTDNLYTFSLPLIVQSKRSDIKQDKY